MTRFVDTHTHTKLYFEHSRIEDHSKRANCASHSRDSYIITLQRKRANEVMHILYTNQFATIWLYASLFKSFPKLYKKLSTDNKYSVQFIDRKPYSQIARR